MTRLAERRTRLTFETSSEMRYRGKLRPIIVEPDQQGTYLAVRLKGSRMRYEVSWSSVFELAAKLHADRARAEKKKARELKRKGITV